MPKDPNGTFVFGAAGAPETFDPLYATDGETFRISEQLFEGLVGFKPGTADMEPSLAESWTHSDDGLTWDFKIRPNVTFTDGTPMNAEAACYNLDRMYTQTGAGATQAEYWSLNMGGFKDQKDENGKAVPSIYSSCTVKDDMTAEVKLTRYTSKFPAILGLPSYSMQSPTALKKYDANDVKAQGDSFIYPAYATDHPTGTGPFELSKYDKQNNTITLTRNDNYWGQKAKVKTLIFQVIPDETARKQALEAGTIDGYDLPNPGDWADLKSKGFQVDVRPAFNILYLGFNFKNNPALKDLKVRQAIAYAMNREQFVKTQLPEGAVVAKEFYPDTVDGWTDQVQQYQYDPDKAKSLLKEYGKPVTLNFWWPTQVSRPYMPDPKSVFTAFSADLEAVGIKINATSKPWNGGYLDGVTAHQPDLFLLGWTGDYNTPDNFLGNFFSSPSTNNFDTAGADFGNDLADALAKADAIPDEDQRNAAYVDLNKKIMGDWLPGVPISSSPPAIVVAGDVKGLIPSPLTHELYSLVYKG
ncbi:MAG TPA: ABC transporter substrate-binding protein [Nakamurella sp.]|jgi:peptide/nickel transport system substrate-binding protein|nr:ABC transporter substrate-binding protein [Nakamurella sp.]